MKKTRRKRKISTGGNEIRNRDNEKIRLGIVFIAFNIFIHQLGDGYHYHLW